MGYRRQRCGYNNTAAPHRSLAFFSKYSRSQVGEKKKKIKSRLGFVHSGMIRRGTNERLPGTIEGLVEPPYRERHARGIV